LFPFNSSFIAHPAVKKKIFRIVFILSIAWQRFVFLLAGYGLYKSRKGNSPAVSL